MEIKPQELRIGNLVDRNGIMEVLGIGANNKLVIYDHYNKERLPYGLDVESFKGINLTPEWLERAGFVKSGGYIIHLQEKLWLSVELPIKGSSRTTSDISITWDYVGRWITGKVNYVHQLQNLYFALTGKELAIDKQN